MNEAAQCSPLQRRVFSYLYYMTNNQTLKAPRIQSIDVLRGLVIVIMALDHVRDYFYPLSSDPTNLETTTPILFFTRFITHYCAPVFVFLAGTSAFLYGQNKTKGALSKFLLTRGVWLVFLEVTVMTVLWWFSFSWDLINLQVLWAIGVAMIALGLAVRLPVKTILVLGLILVIGHNALDGIFMEGEGPAAVLWYVLHQPNMISVGETYIMILYPIIPWIGVILLGYAFGQLYAKGFDAGVRKKWLLRLGLACLGSFLVVRGINIYGDPVPWTVQKDSTFTFLSFINVTKYGPSLSFLLVTLGPAFLVLLGIERLKNKFTDFFLVYGRVPFFFYVLHVLVIHFLAVIILMILGQDWSTLVGLKASVFFEGIPGYGYALWVTYAAWIGVVLFFYPLCLRYMKYKAANRDKWWLSYL